MNIVRPHKLQKQARCQGCGSTRLHFVRHDPPFFGRFDCLSCGRHGPWLPAPWSLERTRAFTLPFGKFKGWSMGQLEASKDGRNYLRWASENLEGNAGTAARIVLGVIAPGEAPA